MKKIIKNIFKSIVLISFLSLCSVQAFALESFVVRDIRIQGLHRIKYGTVLNYLPLKVGDRLGSNDTAKIIRTLYKTGFFSDVRVARNGNTLVINVLERQTIGRIKVSGNHDIPRDKLLEVLKDVGLDEGRVYDVSVLERLKEELKTVYNSQGKYNATITATVNQLPRNRVAIDIKITEGKPAKIKQINIIGNHAFSDRQLRKEFVLTTSGLFTWLSKGDQYSKEKLKASIENIRSFYLNRGYIKMKIVSQQVSLSPDHKHVFITVKIFEGPRYRFSGFKLRGHLILPEAELNKLVSVKKGEVFSRKEATASVSRLGDKLAEHGYGFPQINAEPNINEATKEIFMTFVISPGVRVYVRRINFKGNNKTADYVLRHAMKQEEGAQFNLANVKESERQLRIKPFFKNVNVKTTPVAGTNNQVDLLYQVEEAPSTEATVSAGYSTTDRIVLGAGINEPNFLGTGKQVGVNFTRSQFTKDYSFNYFNPYYSPKGIGRGVTAYYSQSKSGNVSLAEYTSNRVGGALNYSYELNDRNNLLWGLGYEHVEFTLGNFPVIPQYAAFAIANGSTCTIPSAMLGLCRFGVSFNQARLTGGWVYNSYDRFPFPTKGLRQRLTALLALPVDSKSLEYYKVAYTGHAYLPLIHDMVFSLRGHVSYGDGLANTNIYPFYENYYAGGIGIDGQVRGYDSYSLGPRDTSTNPNPIGGNFLVAGGAEIALPYPFSRDTLRTSLFVDAGNVYVVNQPAAVRGTSAGPFRYSAGVSVEWRSPFGPLQFSLAKPINKQPGDRLQVFQFTVSTGF